MDDNTMDYSKSKSDDLDEKKSKKSKNDDEENLVIQKGIYESLDFKLTNMKIEYSFVSIDSFVCLNNDKDIFSIVDNFSLGLQIQSLLSSNR